MPGAEGGRKGLTAEEQKGTLGSDGNVLHHDCADAYTTVSIVRVKLVDFFAWKVYLSEVD